MPDFTITSFVPQYERSGNMGDPRRFPVGLRAIDVRCNTCGATWRATPSPQPSPGHFREFTGNFELTCTSCEHREVIALRPLMLLAKGQHTVAIGGEATE